MATWLSSSRERVKEALTANMSAVNVWDYNPERVTAPAIAVSYGNPLLSDGLVFGEWTVRHSVTLIPLRGSNEAATDALDALIEKTVEVLAEAGYGIEQVGQPYMLSANNANYLAVDVQITDRVDAD